MMCNSVYELCTTYDVICSSCFCLRSWDQQNCEGRRPKEVSGQVIKTWHYHHHMTPHDITWHLSPSTCSHTRCSRQRSSWVHLHSWFEPVKQRNMHMQYDWSRYTWTLYMYVCHTNHTLGIDKIIMLLFLPIILFYYFSKFYLLFSLTLPIIPNKNQNCLDDLHKT